METTKANIETYFSGRHTAAAGTMAFFQLTSKVVGTEEDVSEKSKDIIYYNLAMGHNLGTLDCFDAVVSCSASDYDEFLSDLPEDSWAHFKLDGLRKFGEIDIMQEQAVRLLGDLLPLLKRSKVKPGYWLNEFVKELQLVENDPVVYLIGKRL